jgi:hypothetical protein
VRRQTEPISLLSIRKSIWFHRCAKTDTLTFARCQFLTSCVVVGSDRWSVRLRYSQTNQISTGEGDIHICRRSSSPDCCLDERYLRGAQVRHFLLVQTFDTLLSLSSGMKTISYMSVTQARPLLDGSRNGLNYHQMYRFIG